MSGKGTMRNFKAMLAEAKLPERTVDICLRGDLVAEHEDAERELEQAEKKATDSLAGNGVSEIVERIEALEEQMREATQTFTLRALPHRRSARDDRPTHNELRRAHPPRRDEAGEIVESDDIGYNVETFNEALVRLCAVEPELDAADWDELLAVISEGQFSVLASACLFLNRGDINVPFSRAASRAKRATAEG
jgi:hypothetical protein